MDKGTWAVHCSRFVAGPRSKSVSIESLRRVSKSVKLKSPVQKLSAEDVARDYPIADRVHGWYFRVREQSAGVWLATGTDLWGRQVSSNGHDEHQVLEDCCAAARRINASINAPLLTTGFSLRELLLTFAAVALILSAYVVEGVTTAAFITAIVACLIIVRGRRTKRRWLKWSGIALAVPSVVIVLLAVALWFFLFGSGPIFFESSYPREFVRMAQIAGVDTSGGKIFGRGAFIDTEHVWRLSMTPQQLEQVTTNYGWSEIPSGSAPTALLQAFPFWWRPSHGTNCRFLATPNFPANSRGPDGEHYLAMYAPDQEQFYVWYKSNF